LRTLHDINDPRLVKALAHPLRIRILAILEDRVASPSEIAEQLDAPLGNVSYHVRQLAELGLISLVRETPVRGTLEHHYKAEIRPRITDKAWSTAPDIVKHAQARAVSIVLARGGNAVTAVIEDDGRGFTPGDDGDGLGLLGMGERLATAPGPDTGFAGSRPLGVREPAFHLPISTRRGPASESGIPHRRGPSLCG